MSFYPFNPLGHICTSILPATVLLPFLLEPFHGQKKPPRENTTATMSSPTPTLPDSFYDPVLAIQDRHLRIRWYMCVIVNLSSLNYADVIPQVYSHLDANLLSPLSHDERFDALQKIREGLTKSVGIVGAARTGTAMRTLADCTPEDLLPKESPRAQESEETAIKRGNEFFDRVYARNPLFDVADTERASPDYLFVVKGIPLSFSFTASRLPGRRSG
jgi:hypothetical protein